MVECDVIHCTSSTGCCFQRSLQFSPRRDCSCVVVARYDRSKHGGGLLIGAKEHMPVNVVDCSKYCDSSKSQSVAEMVAVEYNNVIYSVCYTIDKSIMSLSYRPRLPMYMRTYILTNYPLARGLERLNLFSIDPNK